MSSEEGAALGIGSALRQVGCVGNHNVPGTTLRRPVSFQRFGRVATKGWAVRQAALLAYQLLGGDPNDGIGVKAAVQAHQPPKQTR